MSGSGPANRRTTRRTNRDRARIPTGDSNLVLEPIVPIRRQHELGEHMPRFPQLGSLRYERVASPLDTGVENLGTSVENNLSLSSSASFPVNVEEQGPQREEGHLREDLDGGGYGDCIDPENRSSKKSRLHESVIDQDRKEDHYPGESPLFNVHGDAFVEKTEPRETVNTLPSFGDRRDVSRELPVSFPANSGEQASQREEGHPCVDLGDDGYGDCIDPENRSSKKSRLQENDIANGGQEGDYQREAPLLNVRRDEREELNVSGETVNTLPSFGDRKDVSRGAGPLEESAINLIREIERSMLFAYQQNGCVSGDDTLEILTKINAFSSTRPSRNSNFVHGSRGQLKYPRGIAGAKNRVDDEHEDKAVTESRNLTRKEKGVLRRSLSALAGHMSNAASFLPLRRARVQCRPFEIDCGNAEKSAG